MTPQQSANFIPIFTNMGPYPRVITSVALNWILQISEDLLHKMFQEMFQG